MILVKTVIADFIAAWNMLSDRALPRIPGPLGTGKATSAGVLVCFPLIGLVSGFLTVAVALLAQMCMSRFAGAFVFMLLAGAVLWFKDSGRGLSMLISYAARRFSGMTSSRALDAASPGMENSLGSPMVMMFSAVGIVALLGMLFALFYRGAALWFPAVLTADALVQARLCLLTDRRTGSPFLRNTAPGDMLYLAAAGIAAAVLMLVIFPRIAAFGAAVIVWVWFWRELPESPELKSGIAADWISLWGFWAAVLMLICGMGLL